MSSSSLYCARCHSPRPKTSKSSSKNVKICVRTIERGTSPITLIAPCGSQFENLPFDAGSECPSPQLSVQEHVYCPYHNKGQVSTMAKSKYCCTPAIKYNECKCNETCEAHGPYCPSILDKPLRSRSSARMDPDPLEQHHC